MKKQQETTDDNSGDGSDEELFYDEVDNGQMENSDSDESCKENDADKEQLKSGNVVWGLHGRCW